MAPGEKSAAVAERHGATGPKVRRRSGGVEV